MDPLKKWRLLTTGHKDAYTNMAVDEAILRAYRQKAVPPTLRIYGWHPAAISIGCFQDAARELDLARCKQRSIDFVRRITGGSIVFHAEELTYSIVCLREHFRCDRSVENSFKRICSFIIKTYEDLGLRPGFAVDQNGLKRDQGRKTAFCFSGREKYDILVNGKKLGGNAQRRFRNIIFQHGFIPLKVNLGFAGSFLRKRPLDLENRVTSLTEALGRPIEFGEIASRLIRNFREINFLELSGSGLSAQENELVECLNKEKYSKPEWNIFRRSPEQNNGNCLSKTALA